MKTHYNNLNRKLDKLQKKQQGTRKTKTSQQHNVKDSISLANDLTKLKIDWDYRMITFDVKDLYVNIPTTETLPFTKHLLSNHNEEHITPKILTLLETVLQQNYFSFQNNTFQLEKGV
jgi:hypothetical protein